MGELFRGARVSEKLTHVGYKEWFGDPWML
ncbi:hypothetical protein JJ691_80460 [Kutzneria sp. CA-103260]|nr:hypothetical protein JJ691_80460 [Kutzneria sp. CA-103260]